MARRGILFDKDGTLIDMAATWVPLSIEIARLVAGGDEALANRLLEHGGFDTERQTFRGGSPLAAGTPAEIAESFAEVLGEGARHEALATTIADRFLDGLTHSVLLPGISEELRALQRRGAVLGVATSDSIAGIEATLGPHGVLPLFSFLAGYDSGFGRKPEPGIVEAFRATCGLEAHDVAVVGDNTHDLRMGRAANAGLVIGVLSGTSTADDFHGEADMIVASVADLLTEARFMAWFG